MSLFLVGMRGVGKSSAGQRAAASLGVDFLDSDRLVEERAGRSIADLFAAEGEAHFRELEREILLEVLQRPAQIAATGGGCVLDVAVRQALRRQGQVLWLTAPSATLRQRIHGSGRPSLTGGESEAEVAQVLEQREALYRELADAIVDTAGRTLEEVAHVIEHLRSVLPHHHLR